MDIVAMVNAYGFPVVACGGLGYFIYFIWRYIGENIEPELETMHFALIKVIDQVRMLDQDLIRLQMKVDVVLEYRSKDNDKNE